MKILKFIAPPLVLLLGAFLYGQVSSIPSATGGGGSYSAGNGISISGSTISADLEAGASGALDYSCAASPCTFDVTSIVPLLNGTNTLTGAWIANGASRTAPNKSGTSLPGTCTVGDTFQDTDAAAASQFLVCTSTNTWTAQGGGGVSLGTSAFVAPVGVMGAAASGMYAGDGPGAVVYDGFIAPASGTITKIAINTTASTGATKALAVGLYDSSCNRLAQGRVINTSGSNTVYEITLDSSVTLTAGALYFQAVAAEGADPVPISFGAISSGGNMLSNLTTKMHFNGANATSGTDTTYSLPATCGTRNTSYYRSAVTVLLQ